MIIYCFFSNLNSQMWVKLTDFCSGGTQRLERDIMDIAHSNIRI